MNGKKPNKQEKQWLDAIIEHGCIVCKTHNNVWSPAEVHHINGGSNHMDTIPLCYYHHREGSNTNMFVSRHPHKFAFELEYGPEEGLLNDIMDMVDVEIS